MIKIGLDNKLFKYKPNNANEIQQIPSRIKTVECTTDELITALLNGATFRPSVLSAKSSKSMDFIQQEIFVIDIDNNDYELPILTVDDAIQICSNYQLPIYIAYYSFSHTIEKPKFRLIFKCNEVIRDIEVAKHITYLLISIFPQADKNCKDVSRFFFGTNKSLITGNENITNELHKPFGESFDKEEFLSKIKENNVFKINQSDDLKNYKKQNKQSLTINPLFSEYLKNQVFQRQKELLTPAKQIGYICPLCDNGNGSDGDGLVEHKNNHYKCFKCGFYGDIFELIGQLHGINNIEAFKLVYEMLDINIQDNDNCVNTKNENSNNTNNDGKIMNINELEKYRIDNYLDNFLQNVRDDQLQLISTGFQGLDQILDGGITSGLYIIGAISSLGKTTFALQMADNIAKNEKNEQDVIFISLEMSRFELMAKTISRESFQLTQLKHENKKNSKYAKTTKEIIIQKNYDKYSKAEINHIMKSIEQYKKYAKNLYIYESVNEIGVKEVCDIVNNHVKMTNKKPVLFIDYLQILAPFNSKSTDKQNVDKSVFELKKLSRELNIPIVAISSFNRESYTEPVSTTSFKESGAIEYSSDVLLGLQYYGIDYELDEKEVDRKKRIRNIINEQITASERDEMQKLELKILKNRNGMRGSVFLKYLQKYNYFECADMKNTAYENKCDTQNTRSGKLTTYLQKKNE